MARRKQTRGTCSYCGRVLARSGMLRHLEACPQREAAIAAANQGAGTTEKLYHLRIQDKWSGEFWLDLEMRGSATLQQLDAYLRAIWLECCGHLSEFSFGDWPCQEIPMERRADQVFRPNVEFIHVYDFGTSSRTLVKAVNMRAGQALTPHPIALMTRNLPPEATCIECGQPAGWLCIQCLYEDDVVGALCDTHVDDHPHDDYGGPLPLLNSPRTRMCGYTGPDEPPY